MILDLFAGPGGWSEGLRMLGLSDVGIEWDAAACATRAAAGHRTIRADVAQYPAQPFAGKVTGLIASPPCQDFSLAGKQAGRTGEKGQLIDVVPYWVAALAPRWIACEQVPPCLPIWEEHARDYRALGYSVWTGVLNAADFGVPQTRKRAILVASLDRPALPPEPTHGRDPEPGLFGTPEAWVSMATALGWGLREEPSPSVMTPRGGGAQNVLNGGSNQRGAFERRMGCPDQWEGPPLSGFKVRTGANSMKHSRDLADLVPYERSIELPAPTIDTKAVGAWTIQPGQEWALERPATTIVGSFCPDVVAAPGYRTEVSRQDAEGSVKITLQDAAVLQSFRPDYPWQGSRTKQFEQVGNAVPPRLAAHVLAGLVGVELALDVAA